MHTAKLVRKESHTPQDYFVRESAISWRQVLPRLLASAVS